MKEAKKEVKKEIKKEVPDNAVSRFQKAAVADGLKLEITGKIDKPTIEAMKVGGKNITKWAKEEIGDIAEFQRRNHMLIHGEPDYFTLERYLR